MIGISKRQHKSGALLLALALSCLLLLQSTLGGLAAGATASGPQRDIFGNLLCSSESGHQNRSADHGAVPACCTLGCLHAAFASAPTPQQGWTLPERVASKLQPVFVATSVHASRDAHSHRPRGPPIVA
jgi:hypothetical protein